MCVCVCRPSLLLLETLICFGSVWSTGHETNYVLKGRSQPNEARGATELKALIKTLFLLHWVSHIEHHTVLSLHFRYPSAEAGISLFLFAMISCQQKPNGRK